MRNEEFTPSAQAQPICASLAHSNSNCARTSLRAALMGAIALLSLSAVDPASAQTPKQPNILFIMGDDIGWFNIGAYHQGIMSGKTPNLDKLASQGMRFTDYYAEASCTAGAPISSPANFPFALG